MRYRVLVMWHLSMTIDEQVNNIDVAIFHMQAMLPEVFPFFSD